MEQPRRSREKLAIIGPGRAGSALAVLLSRRGWKVAAVAGRRAEAARRLARRCGASVCSVDPVVSARVADAVIIAVPDQDISEVATQLATFSGRRRPTRLRASASSDARPAASRRPRGPGSERPRIALHTSGAAGAELLAPLRRSGWSTGSFHPLMTFSGGRGRLPDLGGVTFAIDGDASARRLARRMVLSLRARVLHVPSTHRARYHLAACLASNYLVTLAEEASELLEGAGLTRGRALAALLPLMRATVSNVSSAGILRTLTGPVSRGDAETVRRHAALLRGNRLGLARLHRELVLRTVRLARSAGSLDPKGARRIEKALGR